MKKGNHVLPKRIGDPVNRFKPLPDRPLPGYQRTQQGKGGIRPAKGRAT